MRLVAFLFLLSFGLSGLSAQAWEILNSELKVEREGNHLSISFIDERSLLKLEGDTAFIDEGSGLLFFRKNELMGIVDPYDLLLLQEPSFLSIQTSSDDIFIVEDEEGFYLSEQDFPLVRLTDYFESVDLYNEDAEINPIYRILLVERKGKFGMIVPEIDFVSYVLEPKYDEIIPETATIDNFEYLVRKGVKWGVGNEDGIVIPLKYDELEYIGGECGASAYIAWKAGKCGVVAAYVSQPLVKIEYSFLSYLKKEYQTFLFLFKDEELVGIRASEGYEEWDDYYEPIMIAHLGLTEKIFLIYKGKLEIHKIEITNEELQRLGLASMDWMYFEN